LRRAPRNITRFMRVDDTSVAMTAMLAPTGLTN
jgi:hypothetical protein